LDAKRLKSGAFSAYLLRGCIAAATPFLFLLLLFLLLLMLVVVVVLPT
jgi:hypothetical protein